MDIFPPIYLFIFGTILDLNYGTFPTFSRNDEEYTVGTTKGRNFLFVATHELGKEIFEQICQWPVNDQISAALSIQGRWPRKKATKTIHFDIMEVFCHL